MNAAFGRLALVWAAITLVVAAAAVPALGQAPVVGPNVNMVSGTKFPEGDPFLTKQNELTFAPSSRNPRTWLGGSNDYRMVNVPVAEGLRGAKAWLSVYKSVDGGKSWFGMPMGGCPLNIPECNDPLDAALKALGPDFSADPTVRAGPNGTFFYSFIAGRRDESTDGVVAVKRFIDKNNAIQRDTDIRSVNNVTAASLTRAGGTATLTTTKTHGFAVGDKLVVSGALPEGYNGAVTVAAVPSATSFTYAVDSALASPATGAINAGRLVVKQAEDPIIQDTLWLVDTGVKGQLKDKPWVAADVHRPWNAGQTCELLSWTKGRSDVRDASEVVDAFNVYVSYANFAGQGQNAHPVIFVAVSKDCGKTFGNPVKLSNSLDASQGSGLAVDPTNGAVYATWRRFGSAESPPKPDQIYVSKSTDGGNTWSNQPILVATINPYDQDAAGTAFRTLGFPTIAVSVKDGVSRVHIAWTQRKAMPTPTVPNYACASTNQADCDARIVMATSTNGGLTWPNPVPVDDNFAVSYEAGGAFTSHGRGHQVQPSLAFAAGKLLVAWIDQRFSHTEEVLRCTTGTCASVNDLARIRVAKGNLDPDCVYPAGLPAPLTGSCHNPALVWTSFLSDGTPGLVRRHTVDVFAAMADPGDPRLVVPVQGQSAFASTQVSQYLFGSPVEGIPNANGSLTPRKGSYDVRQLQLNAPNLPLFSNGTAAFIGDYTDVNGSSIVATGETNPDTGRARYKFNVGGTVPGALAPYLASGESPVFQVGFTDNRDVIPPGDGNWSTPTCLVTNETPCNATGFAGNRNQNVFSAVVAENSLAYANANAKRLSDVATRGFVVTVENLSNTTRNYTVTIDAPPGITVSFDKEAFPPQAPPPSVAVQVQPRSSATRTVWVRASSPSDAQAQTRISVAVTGPDGFSTRIPLNADSKVNNDPTGGLVGNGDGPVTPDNPDLANDDLGNVVLSNAVLSNNVLSNVALSNNALSNNALTNAVLSNVVLSNAVLSNDPLVNAVLSNVALSNAVLSNDPLINAVLSNAVLSNAMLTNNALSNVALSNVALSNVALSNAVLSNNVLSNVALSNNSLDNVMLSNAVLSNVALSNVALSNAALSNAVLSNNALSNAVLSNAPLTDNNLKPIEAANFDLSNNGFTVTDLGQSYSLDPLFDGSFADVSLTVRNRGNVDTTLAIKLIMRDAICPTNTSDPCALPDDLKFKLQLVLRKVSLTPTAIPPTGPAVNSGRDLRLGLLQTNAQVSNVSTPIIVNPEDVDLGRFQPFKADAATLPLAAGERAHVALRALGAPGFDPVELLRWGIKLVVVDASNNTRTRIPLIIRTLSVPDVTALQPAALTIRTFGGSGTISGSAQCADSKGTPIASPCLPAPMVGPFAADGTATVSFTPQVQGDFYLLVKVADASVPTQRDQQLLKIRVHPASQTISPTLADLLAGFLNPDGTLDLRSTPIVLFATSSSQEEVVFAGSGACSVVKDTNPASPTYGKYLLATLSASPPLCTVTATVNGNATYATFTVRQDLTINKGYQTITFAALPDRTIGGPAYVSSFVVAATATSGLAVTFAASGDCAVAGNEVTLATPTTWPGNCTITAKQAGNQNWNPAPDVSQTFAIKRAALTITANDTSKVYGDPVPSLGATFGFAESTCGAKTGTLALTTAVTATSNAGTYPNAITATNIPSYSLCAVTFVPGTLTVTQATPAFTNLSAPVISPGTASTPIGGRIAYGSSVFPASPPPVRIALGGVIREASPQAPDGSFSATFDTGALGVGTYPIGFSYAGSSNFTGATGNSVLVVEGFVAAASMAQPRSWHTATRLADGRVLVAGGFDASGAPTASSEVFCPAVIAGTACAVASDVGKFKPAGNLPSKSAGHTATLLVNGTVNAKVLAAGGGNSSTELFDPLTNSWSAGGGMSSTRSYHTATPILDAAGNVVKVLLAGGADNAGKTLNSTLIYTVANGSFSAGPNLASARERHTAVRLADGRILIVGGRVKAGSGYNVLASVEIYNPVSNAFVSGAAMAGARHSHGAVLLADGRALVVGGSNGTSDVATAEIYAPATNGWTAAGSLAAARRELTLSEAPDGEFLIAGGQGGTVRLKSTAIYAPPFVVGPDMTAPRAGHTATPLLDGTGAIRRVLVVGGIGADGKSTATAEIFQ